MLFLKRFIDRVKRKRAKFVTSKNAWCDA